MVHLWQHLFTCDLNGKDLKNITDCVERLKYLDHTGGIWGQNMKLEVRGANLLLTDFETQVNSSHHPLDESINPDGCHLLFSYNELIHCKH